MVPTNLTYNAVLQFINLIQGDKKMPILLCHPKNTDKLYALIPLNLILRKEKNAFIIFYPCRDRLLMNYMTLFFFPTSTKASTHCSISSVL